MQTVLAALALALVLAGCGESGDSRRPTVPPAPSRVVVLVMENKEYGQVIGSSQAPYANALARRYALASRYYAIRHPSLPNYLALFGGSTFNVTSNCTSCSIGVTNLVDQLEAARVPWKAYMENMPRPCYRGALFRGYAKKHNPFAYFKSIVRDPGRCSKVVPYRRLTPDLRAGRLPPFVWITPNQCHQTHDCGVPRGDSFLRRLVPRLLRRLGPRGALFLLWEEGRTDGGCCRLAHGGRVPAIVAGPGARRGLISKRPFDHYSTLRTIEDAFGLRHLRGAACGCTGSLRPLFRRPPRIRAARGN
jgi:phosphatidylinositol-3-phosphatase